MEDLQDEQRNVEMSHSIERRMESNGKEITINKGDTLENGDATRRMERIASQPHGQPPMSDMDRGRPDHGVAITSEPLKRPRDATAFPTGEGDKKRAKRLFGSLMGTLARAQKEDEAAKEIALKRAVIQRKAEERQKEEAEKLKKQKAELRERDRAMEAERARRMELDKRVQRLEQEAAARIERRKRHHDQGLLLTSCPPSLYWKPSVESKATEALRKRQVENIAKWSAGVLESLELEKNRLLIGGGSGHCNGDQLEGRSIQQADHEAMEENPNHETEDAPAASIVSDPDNGLNVKRDEMDELLYG